MFEILDSDWLCDEVTSITTNDSWRNICKVTSEVSKIMEQETVSLTYTSRSDIVFSNTATEVGAVDYFCYIYLQL